MCQLFLQLSLSPSFSSTPPPPSPALQLTGRRSTLTYLSALCFTNTAPAVSAHTHTCNHTIIAWSKGSRYDSSKLQSPQQSHLTVYIYVCYSMRLLHKRRNKWPNMHTDQKPPTYDEQVLFCLELLFGKRKVCCINMLSHYIHSSFWDRAQCRGQL